MSDHKEPVIIINGYLLTEAQAMTVRVAIQTFAFQLSTEGLGPTAHGRLMARSHLDRILEINASLQKVPR